MIRIESSLPLFAILGAFTCSLFAQQPLGAQSAVPLSKPVVGINVDVSEEKKKAAGIPAAYYEAIVKSGGIPILIPPMPDASLDEVLSMVDAVVMIGGEDYPPSLYAQKPEPSTVIMHADRADFDMKLAHRVLEHKDLPFLGICAGCQALNIASGGSLIQDIPSHNPNSKVSHAGASGWQKGSHRHDVQLVKSSKLAQALSKERLEVPSSHHQCVDRVGNGLHVVASSDDGVTEAVEGEGKRFLVGVQWHPEKDFEANGAIFAELIRQADEHRKQRQAVSTKSATPNAAGR